MPYSVPPPAPPPVVNFLQPEDFTNAAPPGVDVVPRADASAPPIAPADRAARSAPAPETFAPERSASPLLTSLPPAPAAALGAPLEIRASAPAAAGFVMPELDSLAASPPRRRQLELPELPQPGASDLPSVLPSPPDAPAEPAAPLDAAPAVPGDAAPADSVPADGTPADGTPAESIEIIPSTLPPPAPGAPDVIELEADRQEYDSIRQIFTGEGNVTMRFRDAVLNADRVQVNLPNRIAVAEGNARLTRGDQLLVGERFTYNFVQTEGTVLRARGEVFLPTTSTDISLSPVVDDGTLPDPNIYGVGGLNLGVGNDGRDQTGGNVRRLRFEADRIDFTADGWVASNVRITNDPFSPPELEVRARTATFTRLSPLRSEIRARNPRIVFDRGLSLPLLRDRVVIDNRERDPSLIRFGFDQEERGGLFVEGNLTVLSTPAVQLRVRPQSFLQRAFIDSDNIFAPENFGLVTQLDARLSPTTTLEANTVLTSFDLQDLDDNLRASIRTRQLLGRRHVLSLEYSYRDRLFNGSLGYQNVQSSLGFVLASREITLGDSGIRLQYQAGAQIINANTDRLDLLEPIRDNNRIDLTRYQASVTLSRFFTLWQGQPLPATREEGLRFSPSPQVPYLLLVPSVRGVFNLYSNGDTQQTIRGSLGLFGQFGRFSRDFLDYTAFNVTYSQSIREGESPFLFDRDVDERVLSGGIIQQLYGPFRAGFQTAINLDRDEEIETTYILEYSRRTYTIALRINPTREVASLGIRINDFNWGSDRGPFSGFTGSVQDGLQLQPSN